MKLCGFRTFLFILLFAGAALLIYIRSIHHFLSPTHKIDPAKILVVEGLTPDFALPGAIEEFRRNEKQLRNEWCARRRHRILLSAVSSCSLLLFHQSLPLPFSSLFHPLLRAPGK